MHSDLAGGIGQCIRWVTRLEGVDVLDGKAFSKAS